MTVSLASGRIDRGRLALAADWLAVAVAATLPWSTSISLICIGIWFVVLLPTLDAAAMRREVMTAAGGLPVLLFLCAVFGMLWADVTWAERVDGLGGFYRLLAIPLLLAQFRRSGHGDWVLYGLLASSIVLLVLSLALALYPALPWRAKGYGIPVRDYIFQSTLFLICVFALLGRVCDALRDGAWQKASRLAALAALFFVDIVFVATSRTVLIVASVLVVLLGWRQFGWRGALAAGLVGVLLGGALWAGSPYLRARVLQAVDEVRAYDTTDAPTSSGLRLEFWKKSLGFVQAAPLIGHGTGTIADQFRRAASGGGGAASVAPVNPHNQIFGVAIQLGLLGTVVLVAMWVAHFMLFRGGSLAAWIGTVVVVQNVVSSLANSHLFDFAHGWLYVFGVGILGGTVLRQQEGARP